MRSKFKRFKIAVKSGHFPQWILKRQESRRLNDAWEKWQRMFSGWGAFGWGF